jgi:hypothetical protein
MHTSPSIAPHGPEQDTYIVLDDFGSRIGRAWRETDGGGHWSGDADRRPARGRVQQPRAYRFLQHG